MCKHFLVRRPALFTRELQHHGKAHSRLERLAYWAACFVLRHPWLYRVLQHSARAVLAPFARAGWLRRLPGPGAGWTAERDFPAPARRTFRDLWNRNEV